MNTKKELEHTLDNSANHSGKTFKDRSITRMHEQLFRHEIQCSYNRQRTARHE